MFSIDLLVGAGVAGPCHWHAAGHISFDLLFKFQCFSSVVKHQFWASCLMFSGSALQSCVVRITNSTHTRDSIVNPVLQGFQKRTLQGPGSLAAEDGWAFAFIEMPCTRTLSARKAESHLSCYLRSAMVGVFKATLKFETWNLGPMAMPRPVQNHLFLNLTIASLKKRGYCRETSDFGGSVLSSSRQHCDSHSIPQTPYRKAITRDQCPSSRLLSLHAVHRAS